jgi:hypothetical protein
VEEGEWKVTGGPCQNTEFWNLKIKNFLDLICPNGCLPELEKFEVKYCGVGFEM